MTVDAAKFFLLSRLAAMESESDFRGGNLEFSVFSALKRKYFNTGNEPKYNVSKLYQTAPLLFFKYATVHVSRSCRRSK